MSAEATLFQKKLDWQERTKNPTERTVCIMDREFFSRLMEETNGRRYLSLTSGDPTYPPKTLIGCELIIAVTPQLDGVSFCSKY